MVTFPWLPSHERRQSGSYRRFLLVAAAIGAVFVVGLSFGYGSHLTALVNGDLVLDYERELTIPWNVNEVAAELHVWNGGLSDLEIMGLSSPCPSCIHPDEIPTTIGPCRSRLIKIRLPVRHLPTDQEIPLSFRLLCDRPVANAEFAFSLLRLPQPVDDRVPTLARPEQPASKKSAASIASRAGEGDESE